MVVVMLLIYSVLHCLYSDGNKITTTTISYEVALRWMSLDLAEEKSTLVEAMPLPGLVITQIYTALWSH